MGFLASLQIPFDRRLASDTPSSVELVASAFVFFAARIRQRSNTAGFQCSILAHDAAPFQTIGTSRYGNRMSSNTEDARQTERIRGYAAVDTDCVDEGRLADVAATQEGAAGSSLHQLAADDIVSRKSRMAATGHNRMAYRHAIGGNRHRRSICCRTGCGQIRVISQDSIESRQIGPCLFGQYQRPRDCIDTRMPSLRRLLNSSIYPRQLMHPSKTATPCRKDALRQIDGYNQDERHCHMSGHDMLACRFPVPTWNQDRY